MSAARLLLSALLVLLCGAHSGCKSSSSSPTKPEPEVERGTVTLLHNGSGFSASVRAAECVQTEQLQMEADDFTDADFLAEIQCSAEAQGEGHSGRVDAEALLRFLYDGPDGQISEIRFGSLVRSNRSATGLASAGASSYVLLRFEVTDEPVPFRVFGSHACMDATGDFYWLVRLSSASSSTVVEEVFRVACGNNMGDLTMDVTGELPLGVYELRVGVQTIDWFTEESSFRMLFTE